MTKPLKFTQILPRLSLPAHLVLLTYPRFLPAVTALPRLQLLKIRGGLPSIMIPVFPDIDPRALKDATNDFILGADGDVLWGSN